MRNLEQAEEVMLTGLTAQGAHLDGFNPYYGLVVKDHGWNVTQDDKDDWWVTVLWEDGKERRVRRRDLLAWKDLDQKRKDGA